MIQHVPVHSSVIGRRLERRSGQDECHNDLYNVSSSTVCNHKQAESVIPCFWLQLVAKYLGINKSNVRHHVHIRYVDDSSDDLRPSRSHGGDNSGVASDRRPRLLAIE